MAGYFCRNYNSNSEACLYCENRHFEPSFMTRLTCYDIPDHKVPCANSNEYSDFCENCWDPRENEGFCYKPVNPNKKTTAEQMRNDKIGISGPFIGEINYVPIDIIRAWNLSYPLGVVLERIYQAVNDTNDPLTDLLIAKDYLEIEISYLEDKE